MYSRLRARRCYVGPFQETAALDRLARVPVGCRMRAFPFLLRLLLGYQRLRSGLLLGCVGNGDGVEIRLYYLRLLFLFNSRLHVLVGLPVGIYERVVFPLQEHPYQERWQDDGKQQIKRAEEAPAVDEKGGEEYLYAVVEGYACRE